MIFERIKSEGIAHNAYLIGSESDAAVIAPRRDCQVYTDLAQQRGLKIKYIFETHRNEDYVIGSQFDISNSRVVRWLNGGLMSKVSSALKMSKDLTVYNVKVENGRVLVEV
jgi:glyoxylase-like metal-dependent hydrolase (beta-lactamase superfamily II)